MTPAAPHLPAVTRAGVDQLPMIAGLLAEAFADLPVAHWLVPDRERREDVLRSRCGIWVEHAMHVGQVDALADSSGAAVWFDRTRPTPDPPDYDRRSRVACGRYADGFDLLDDLLAHHRPDMPHEHLAFLAVTQRHHGTGRAKALVQHHHRILDDVGVPAYLEAASPENVGLYESLGYTVSDPVYLPAGPPFWPMLRPPLVPARVR